VSGDNLIIEDMKLIELSGMKKRCSIMSMKET
jgi:hypothetical protein